MWYLRSQMGRVWTQRFGIRLFCSACPKHNGVNRMDLNTRLQDERIVLTAALDRRSRSASRLFMVAA